MPTFSVHIVNSEFVLTNSIDASNSEDARSQALKGTLQIGVDEVCKGSSPFFGAEIRIEEGGEVVERLMVAIGASALQ